MKQREIQDNDNRTWVCVQALSGLSKEASEKAAEKMISENGKVRVVCTPNGGEQSVQVELDDHWEESLGDEQLIQKISEARK